MHYMNHVQEQRERNVAIAKGFINRFDEIPPLLDPLLGSRKYEEAAELLRRYVRSDVRTDGVLLCPERDIFALLVNTDEPDVAAVRKMLSQRSADLQREYLAAKQSLDHPSRDISLQLDEAIKAIAQIVTDAQKPEPEAVAFAEAAIAENECFFAITNSQKYKQTICKFDRVNGQLDQI